MLDEGFGDRSYAHVIQVFTTEQVVHGSDREDPREGIVHRLFEGFVLSVPHLKPEEGSDLDAVFPLETLRRLVRDGVVGDLSARHFSFMGAIHDPTPLVEKTAPKVAGNLIEDRADVVLLTPS